MQCIIIDLMRRPDNYESTWPPRSIHQVDGCIQKVQRQSVGQSQVNLVKIETPA